MDDIDRRLIGLLRENARIPVVSLASILGISRATVQARLDKLLREGVLTGFTVKLRPEAEPNQVRAIMMIEVEGERSEQILGALKRYPEIVAIYSTNGRWDLVVELRTGSLEAFDRALRRIREMKGIASSETSLLLSTYKS